MFNNATTDNARLPLGNWVENSFGPDIVGIASDDFIILNYVALAVAITILVHSFYLHRYKYSSVRICNDASACAIICLTCFYLRCANECSVLESALIIDIAVNSICCVIVQYSDNYMTWKRYAVIVTKLPPSTKYFAFAYVVILLFGCWLPFFTIVPFFVNMNNEDMLLLFQYCQLFWNFPCYVAYNLFFDSILIAKVIELRKANNSNTGSSYLQGLAWKAIAHNLMSSLGVALYSFYIPLGTIMQAVLYMLSIHFIFNWKAPYKFFSSASMAVLSQAHSGRRKVSSFSTRLRTSQRARATIEKSLKSKRMTTSQRRASYEMMPPGMSKFFPANAKITDMEQKGETPNTLAMAMTAAVVEREINKVEQPAADRRQHSIPSPAVQGILPAPLSAVGTIGAVSSGIIVEAAVQPQPLSNSAAMFSGENVDFEVEV